MKGHDVWLFCATALKIDEKLSPLRFDPVAHFGEISSILSNCVAHFLAIFALFGQNSSVYLVLICAYPSLSLVLQSGINRTPSYGNRYRSQSHALRMQRFAILIQPILALYSRHLAKKPTIQNASYRINFSCFLKICCDNAPFAQYRILD